ncbi:MAG: hypothetical protein LDLANPLL_01156 [Turneriella sp.]|nr:hypothetical protein [Turneriella sp.]
MGKSCLKLILGAFFASIAVFPLHPRDVVGVLLEDTIATFSDSYDLLVYSLKAAIQRDLREQRQSVREEAKVTNERVEAYLEAKGIFSRRDRQPITRKEFAQLMFQRFDLPRGFFTKLLKTTSWYYRDAVRLGLFNDTDSSDGTMSTREMLSVFIKAEALGRSR